MSNKPKIKIQDLQKAVKVGKDVLDLGKEALPVIKPVFDEYAPKVMLLVRNAAKAAAETKDAFRDDIQQKKKAKEKKIAKEENRMKNRGKAVSSSIAQISAKEFFKNFKRGVSDPSELDSSYMAISGCYAIITMKSKGEKDLASYKDVFVGCGSSIGRAVYSQLSGLGNVDVYADFKFNQPMWILIYPCDEDNIRPKFESLVKDFGSAGSYNKRDLQSRVTVEE